jgi:hypothetical protein
MSMFAATARALLSQPPRVAREKPLRSWISGKSPGKVVKMLAATGLTIYDHARPVTARSYSGVKA